MDTRSLERFVAVYEAGSIAKAADNLFISPQGLSKSLANLEAELEQPLFQRTTHGVAPTQAADTLYVHAKELIGLLNSVKESMDQTAQTVMDIAVSSGYVTRFGQALLDEFCSLNPTITPRLEEFTDDAVLDEVESGRATCGFSPASPKGRPLDVLPVTNHPFVLLVRPTDPLCAHEALSYDDLAGRKLLALGHGHAPYSIISRHLAAAGLDVAQLSPIIEITTGIDLARRGEACCFITDFAASSFADDGSLVTLPFRDETLTWELGFITRHGVPMSAEAHSLYEIVKRWTTEHRDVLFA